MMERVDFFRSWSELHGGATVKGIVKWWLNIAYSISLLLQKMRFTPNTLTYLGVLLGVALLVVTSFDGGGNSLQLLLALILLTLSLIADGVDGSLALLTSRASRYGAALDSIADRLVEFLWAMVFLNLGADLGVVLAAFLMAQIQEYIRARLGGLGIREVGIVTPSERPVRAIFLAIAIGVALVFSISAQDEIVSFSGEDFISLVAGIWLLVQSIALVMLSRWATRVARR